MASGSFTKQVGNRKNISNEYIKVWWTSTPDVANNRSKVRVYAKMYRPWYLAVDYNQNIELWINGTKYTAKRYGWRGKGWTKAYIDKSVYVPHNSNGTKTIKIRLRTEVKAWLRSYVGWVDTGNHQIKLDNLARKSTFSLSASSVNVGSAIKVNLVRSSTSVRHAISLKIGSKTFNILERSKDNGTTTSYSHTLDSATILPLMSGTSIQGKVTMTTYNGTTSLGSSSKTFTIKLRSTDIPTLVDTGVTITPVAISPNTSNQIFVKGYSKAKIVISATPTTGSTGAIRTYYATVNDTTLSSSSNTITTGVLTKSGKNTIKVYVKDKRGKSSATISKQIDVINYTAPLISNFTIVRCTQEGKTNLSGTYIKVGFKYSVASVGNTNTATITLSQAATGTATFSNKKTWSVTSTAYSGTISEVLGTYDADTSYDFKLTIKDKFGISRTLTDDINTQQMLIDASTSGVAVGKVVERDNAFEVGWNTYCDHSLYAKDLELSMTNKEITALTNTLSSIK